VRLERLADDVERRLEEARAGSPNRDGETEIVGRVEDDAELRGILDTIGSLGLSLVSVAPLPQDRP
jgi:hypothetical protein